MLRRSLHADGDSFRDMYVYGRRMQLPKRCKICMHYSALGQNQVVHMQPSSISRREASHGRSEAAGGQITNGMHTRSIASKVKVNRGSSSVKLYRVLWAVLVALTLGFLSMPLFDLARPHLKRLCGSSSYCLGAIAAPARPPVSSARAVATAAPVAAPTPAASKPFVQPKQQQRPQRGTTTTTRVFSSGSGAMPLQYRPPIVVRASEKHTGTVIMLREFGWLGWHD